MTIQQQKQHQFDPAQRQLDNPVPSSFSDIRGEKTPAGQRLRSSSVHGILQASILEWVAMSYSRGTFPTQGSNPPSGQIGRKLSLLFTMRTWWDTCEKSSRKHEDSTKTGSPGVSDSQAISQVWFAFLSPEASVPCPLIL